MTQEEKDLLLKDLCGRLSYNVKISVNDKIESLQGINVLDNVVEYDSCLSSDIEEVKPYLLPLSSMNKEQERQYSFFSTIIFSCFEVDLCEAVAEFHDWFNRNHFDYRGLIEKGLAIDATSLNIY